MSAILRMFACVVLAVWVVGPAFGDGKQPPMISGWGQVVDPDGDCTVKEDRGKLTIAVPATLHDLNPRNGRLNAPRVLQDVEGDFLATVRVTGDFVPGMATTAPRSAPFLGAGLIVWENEKNYVRLERNVWRAANGQLACYPPLFEAFKDGNAVVSSQGTSADFFQGNSTSFRLERKGNALTASCSHDGKEWVFAKEAEVELPKKVQVGVSAINTSDKPFSMEFDEFTLEMRK